MANSFDIKMFYKLPEPAQHLLELSSVIYSEAAATPICQAAVFVGIQLDDSPKPTQKRIKSELDDLLSQGWLIDVGDYATPRYQCVNSMRDELTRLSIKEGRFNHYVAAINQYFGLSGVNGWRSYQEGLRDIRLHVLLGDIRGAFNLVNSYHQQYHSAHPWLLLWGDPLDLEWLACIPEEVMIGDIAPAYLEGAFHELSNISTLWGEVSSFLQNNPDTHAWEYYAPHFYWQYFARGQWSGDLLAAPELGSLKSAGWHVFQAALQMYAGDYATSIKLHKKGLAMLRKLYKAPRGQKIWFLDQFEVLYVLTLLLSGDDKKIAEGTRQSAALVQADISHYILNHYGRALKSGKKETLDIKQEELDSPVSLLILLCTNYWLGSKTPRELLKLTEDLLALAKTAEYDWLVGECSAALAELLPESDPDREAYAKAAKAIQKKLGVKSFLIQLNRPQQEWERALGVLQRLGERKGQAASTTSASQDNERVIWNIQKDVSAYGHKTWYEVSPRLQKRTKKGGWTAGRNIAMKHLYGATDDVSYLDEDDRRVCRCIDLSHEYNYSGYSSEVYSLSPKRVWAALVGHPRVFWADAPGTPLDIQLGKEELLTEREGKKIRIKLHPVLEDDVGYEKDSPLIIEETTVQLRVYQLSEAVLQLHEVLGKKGLLVPPEAESTLRKALETLAPMITIQSDIQVGNEGAATSVKADSSLHIHMLPWGDGLRMMMRVQPFGQQGGPVFPPGNGRSNVMSEVAGKLLKTTRNIKQELKQANQVLQKCSALVEWDDPESDLMLEDPEDCLEALEQLHGLGDSVVLEWPEGEKMRLTSSVTANNMSLKVESKGEWFNLDGKVTVDADTVLSLRQLLALSQQSIGRFVALGDGQFLSLSRQFQKKLESLNAYAEKEGKNGLKIGSIAGLALDDLISDAGELKADKRWKEQTKRLKIIRESKPEVPADLQAELRDYQLEGFQWMSRLAEWGVGACLADDMGLGKTVQTLALLLTRAEQGPALVVAPTSVCNNWFSECQRFAPSLRPVFYRGKDRGTLLESVQAKDLLICSYGLLQQDAELFKARQWNTIVLDEAQAIKNSQAKRTKAAYQLQGSFRLITTGTPVENHLGELWSLFRFLNPGLLLSSEKFVQRFQTPIERDQDYNARQNLKKLVQPFMLRRTKNQVLQELPPRTEITLQVSLGDGERALYEAMRQQAIEALEQEPEADKEVGHLQVLAQITRLRLASCHPKLVMPDSDLPSGKLQALQELVSELLENQHKALIFSQFVKHLALIKEWLDQQGIAYHYLDGSTPQEQRQKSVEAFQRGDRDIFLISLKAGGFGLNLTAADYVIHMDPWWNPAVEDQASDRAHRIGQQRPVTIYRLVAENTIEEKIVKLHQQKRDLADSLLEGSDVSGKLSAQDMIDMIRGEV